MRANKADMKEAEVKAPKKKRNPPGTNPEGRPTKQTPEVEEYICEQLAIGRSLNKICDEAAMPDRITVMRWLAKDTSFATKYALARQQQAEYWVEEMTDIADDSSNDYIERERKDGSIGVDLNGEHISRSKLRIETRRWIAEKMKPKKYGVKVAIGGDEDAPPVKVAHTFDVSHLTLEELDVFEKAIVKAAVAKD